MRWGVVLLSVFILFTVEVLGSSLLSYSGKYEQDGGELSIRVRYASWISMKDGKRTGGSSRKIFFDMKKDQKGKILSQEVIFNGKSYKDGKFEIKIDRYSERYFIKYNYKVKEGKKEVKVSNSFIVEPFGGYSDARSGRGILSIKTIGTPYDTKKYYYVYNKDGKYFELYTKKFKKIANIVFFDNGPDPYSEGVRRVIKDKKYGFINKKNRVTIKPNYDFAYPFKKGYSVVGNGVEFEKMGEHSVIKGGKWGVINKKGKILLPLEYNSIRHIKKNRFEVTKDKKSKTIKL